VDRAEPSAALSASSIERVLFDCCPSELAANVMIVGHHGSETSSRRAFLSAVSPTILVVSSGPKYSSVVLPDQVIISELQGLGQVFRTDVNDAACAMNPTKIGPPADGNAAGCNAVRVTIPAAWGTGGLGVSSAMRQVRRTETDREGAPLSHVPCLLCSRTTRHFEMGGE
jgi:hypothetical protein